MRLGLKALLAALLAAALVVPAATAKPGGGHGHGGGKPAWAGASHSGGSAHGKPEWAGHGKKVEKAHEVKGADETDAETTGSEQGQEDVPKHDNPAWTCKFERDMTGEAFAEKYGENDNNANAFGMCVSEEAHARDGVSEDAQPADEAGQCQVFDEDQATDEEPADVEGTDESTAEDGEVTDESTAAGVEAPDEGQGGAEECAAPDDSDDTAVDEGDSDSDETGSGGDEQGFDDTGSSEETAVLTALLRLLF